MISVLHLKAVEFISVSTVNACTLTTQKETLTLQDSVRLYQYTGLATSLVCLTKQMRDVYFPMWHKRKKKTQPKQIQPALKLSQ